MSMSIPYYKDASPQHTIAKIRSILSDMGVGVEEDLFSHNDVTYSCRIRVVSDGLRPLDIGTNGKGVTRELALASGYAEFMERLQNRFIANEAIRFAPLVPNGKSNEFLFFPDERMERLPYTRFLHRILRLFPNSKETIKQEINRALYSDYDVCYRSIPFAVLSANNDSTFSTETVRLPIVPIRANSSTGMCAGNTPAEAILQGLCEIFERYALQYIWLKDVTPPTISKSIFSNTRVGVCLDKLEAEGYVCEIKDMSLGLDLPVMGLILTNSKSGRKMVRLGSDPDQSVALERCVTEIFQGEQSEIDNAFVDYSTPDKEPNCEKRKNYRKALRDGSGRYPDSFFKSKPTYEPCIWNWRRLKDSRTTLHKAVRWLNQRDFELYIRNNSFAGFCSYHIFVPGLSDQTEELMPFISDYFAQLTDNRDIDSKLMSEERMGIVPLYNVKGSSHDEIKNATEIPRMFSSEIKLFPYNFSQSNRVDINLLLFMDAVKHGDNNQAIEELSRFIERRRSAGYPDNAYLNCTLSYFKKKEIHQTYEPEIVDAVCSDFSKPENVMVNYKFPTCFNCNECPITKDCLFENIIRFNKGINRKLKDYFNTNPIHNVSL